MRRKSRPFGASRPAMRWQRQRTRSRESPALGNSPSSSSRRTTPLTRPRNPVEGPAKSDTRPPLFGPACAPSPTRSRSVAPGSRRVGEGVLWPGGLSAGPPSRSKGTRSRTCWHGTPRGAGRPPRPQRSSIRPGDLHARHRANRPWAARHTSPAENARRWPCPSAWGPLPGPHHPC